MRIAKPAAVTVTAACLLLGSAFLWCRHHAPPAAEPAPIHARHGLKNPAHGGLQELPKNANRRSQQSLRQWAATLDDESLAKVAKDLIASLSDEAGADNADVKCLAWAVFQEWGRRNVNDATAALRGASESVSGNESWLELVRPFVLLRDSACLGYAEVNPQDAWLRLVFKHDLSDRMRFVDMVGGLEPGQTVSACYGQVFGRLLQSSPESANRILENRFADHIGLEASSNALRVYEASLADPQSRTDAFNTLTARNVAAICGKPVSPDDIDRRTSIDIQLNAHNPDYRRPIDHHQDIAATLAGIAQRDPDQALRLLNEVAARLSPADRNGNQLEPLTRDFYRLWASRQPEATVRMLDQWSDCPAVFSLRTIVAEQVYGWQPDLALHLIENVPAAKKDEFLNNLQIDQVISQKTGWWPSPEHDGPLPDWNTLDAKFGKSFGKPQ